MKRFLTMRYPAAWHGEMWREGAPCGNGLCGALVYGGVQDEIILLSHALLWRGGRVQELPDVSDSLAEVRKKLSDHRPDLANTVLKDALRQKGYQPDSCLPLPLGDVKIHRFSQVPHRHYQRRIDMEQAEVRISWEENGVTFYRETFFSRADGLFYTRIHATRPGAVSLGVTMDCHDRETLGRTVLSGTETRVQKDCILYAQNNPDTAYAPAKGDFGGVLRVLPLGGRMTEKGSALEVEQADEVLLVGTLFVGKDRKTGFAEGICALQGDFSYEKALETHAILHRGYYNRVDFSLSEEGEHTNEELLAQAYDGEMSRELAEKMYAYGRYLLVCGTGDRDTLPLHLTGLWGGTYQAFWAIHMFNINFEMIYWNALSGNLPSYLRLALDYVESFLPDFRENARKIYGCRGIFIDSVNTPESGLAACLADHILNWTAGAAWVSEHFYDYWRYTGDTDYLRAHALPFMAEAALFYEDFLKPGKDGKLVFAPCTSPENTPGSTLSRFGPDIQCAVNATMDIAAARELLSNLLEGSRITGLYEEKRAKWTEMLSLLPDYRYNPDGSVKEWADDFYSDNHAHRHQSHMYPLFPGHTVTPESPEFDAFVKAEDHRFALGLSEQSSWSMVFMACVNARMRRGQAAFTALSEMVRSCCMNNLFTLHNDWRRMGSVSCMDMRIAPFQIDANVGFPAAVNEMLLNSSDGNLTLFPALPEQWNRGRLHGVCAVGGFVLDMDWDEDSGEILLRGGSGTVKVLCGPGWCFKSGETEANFSAPDKILLRRL